MVQLPVRCRGGTFFSPSYTPATINPSTFTPTAPLPPLHPSGRPCSSRARRARAPRAPTPVGQPAPTPPYTNGETDDPHCPPGPPYLDKMKNLPLQCPRHHPTARGFLPNTISTPPRRPTLADLLGASRPRRPSNPKHTRPSYEVWPPARIKLLSWRVHRETPQSTQPNEPSALHVRHEAPICCSIALAREGTWNGASSGLDITLMNAFRRSITSWGSRTSVCERPQN
ncbi:hypothetical protein GWK47_021384 [Chionoecetes opilio]|uniref:Uncharacterized protein n=1 Tax=Chionoecetes opilio TaxID=41210 RepID=A0A8J5CKJ2_CHIOP|nr:hypothetical protein GWK47_021384 [Chionoecetes opilio]